MSFHIGQKIVCVDNSPCRDRGGPSRLRVGTIYHVRGIDPETGTGIWLAEIKWPVEWPWKYEGGYSPTRFRPLTERKENLEARREIFNTLLNPSPDFADEVKRELERERERAQHLKLYREMKALVKAQFKRDTP